MSSCHPTIWKFNKAIKTEQSGMEKEYEEIVAGAEPAKKQYYLAMKVKPILEQYEQRNVLQYLHRIAHRI